MAKICTIKGGIHMMADKNNRAILEGYIHTKHFTKSPNVYSTFGRECRTGKCKISDYKMYS